MESEKKIRILRALFNNAKYKKDDTMNWLKNYKMCETDFIGGVREDQSISHVNYLWLNSVIKISRLAYRLPQIIVAPANKESAMLLLDSKENLLLARKTLLQEILKNADFQLRLTNGIQDALVGSFGCWMVYWQPDWQKVILPDTGEEIEADFGEVKIKDVAPDSVYVDPLAQNLNEAKWICRTIKKTVFDLLNDNAYKNLEGLQKKFEKTHGEDNVEAQLSNEVEVVEFYDFRSGEFTAFLQTEDYENKPIREGNISKKNDMFFFYVPWQARTRMYGLFEYLMYRRMQMDSDTINYAMGHIVKSNVPKWLAQGLLPDDVKRIEEAQPLATVSIKEMGIDLSKALTLMPGAPIPRDMVAWESKIKRELSEVAGISEANRTGMTETKRSATELSLIDSGAALRGFLPTQNLVQIMNKLLARVNELMKNITEPVIGVSFSKFISIVPATDPIEYNVKIADDAMFDQYRFEKTAVLKQFIETGLAMPELINLPLVLKAWSNMSGLEEADAFLMAPDDYRMMMEILAARKMRVDETKKGMTNEQKQAVKQIKQQPVQEKKPMPGKEFADEEFAEMRAEGGREFGGSNEF